MQGPRQAGTHARARVSVRRRGRAVHVSPPSRERKYCPSAVAAKIRLGSAGLVATHHAELCSGPGRSASSQCAPWSRLRINLPHEPGGPSPLHSSTKPFRSAHGVTPRVYWAGDWSGLSSQVSPSLRLTCRPLLVVAKRMRSPWRVTLMSWTSSETRPCETLWNVLPPSVERHTPPISRPAHTRSGSSGSNWILVTRGVSTAGQAHRCAPRSSRHRSSEKCRVDAYPQR